jgi:hypothetical protein
MLTSPAIQAFRSELKKIAAAKPSIQDKDVVAIKREVELWNKMRKASPVKVKRDRMADLHGGAYFDQQAKEIGLARNDYESLAHEIGHAELDKKLIGRLLQHPNARTLFNMTPLAGAAAGVLAAKGRKAGLLLPIATAAPTIASEMWATHKGGKKLKEQGATPDEVKRYKRGLRKSLVSYFGPPAEGAGAGALMYLLARS